MTKLLASSNLTRNYFCFCEIKYLKPASLLKPFRTGLIRRKVNDVFSVLTVLYGQAKSCIVMAGFLLQEIIKWRGPMLATWIQFWDHWSTTLLTGTVSPGQTSRCLSNSRWSKSELLKAVPSSAEQGKLVFFCLRSHAIRHQVFSSNTFLSQKASFAIFGKNLRSKSFLELTSQYSAVAAGTIPGWDQFLSEIWIWSESIKRNSHVLCRGLWTVERCYHEES